MPSQGENVKTIFGKALELESADQRAKYLDEACAGDALLRAEVEDLLGAIARAGDFLGGSSPADGTIDQAVTEKPGTVIGPYKLREQIGEGGFSVVYVAEQEEPVARKVALKVIKPGMDTREVIARFEAERQALALMDHPNIAKVLDAGATETGRPYFVMELVKGVPITAFCDAHRLSTRRRLRLFVDVCRAVQHAHQKGIIHRDLKPSNVMVTLHDDKPVAKVIDFGVAKALSHRLTEKTVYTAYGQIVGTPLYMSPEQAQLSGLDVDTRSDVYSLGVLLYELLTGTTPFDKETLRSAGFDELCRIIREDEPPRPSARISTLEAETLSTISDKRKIDPRKLSQSLRGELDWIVMKALEKDRNRRYESAGAFAADVERYLGDEPVQACPPSFGYRLRKTIRRHRSAAWSAAIVLLGLIVFGSYYFYATWQLTATNDELEKESFAKDEAIGKRDQVLEDLDRANQDLRCRQRQARMDLSTFLLTRGQEACREGEVALGLLWMARALEAAPEDAADLDRVIRINLANWQRQTAHLQQAVDLSNRGNDQFWGVIANLPTYGKAFPAFIYRAPDGRAGDGGQGHMSLWDAATGKPTGTPLAFPLAPLTVPPGGASIAISRDRNTLVARSEPKVARIWNVQTRQPIGPPLVHPEEIGWLSLSDDGRILLTTTVKVPGREPVEGTSYLWDATTGTPIGKPLVHPEQHIVKAILSPDGAHVATMGPTKVQLWTTATGEPHGAPLEPPPTDSDFEASGVVDAVFTPDGRHLFVVHSGSGFAYRKTHPMMPRQKQAVQRALRIWDAARRQPVGNPDAPAAFDIDVSDLVFSPDGEHFVAFEDRWLDRRFHIMHWSPQEGSARVVSRHKLQQREMNWPVFSPDGRLLVTKGSDVRIWDVATGEQIGSPLDRKWGGSWEFRPFSRNEHTFLSVDHRKALIWRLPQGVSSPVWSASPLIWCSASSELVMSVTDSKSGMKWVQKTSGQTAISREFYVHKISHAGSPLSRRDPSMHWAGNPETCADVAAFGPEGKTVLTAIRLAAQQSVIGRANTQNEKRLTVLFTELRDRATGQPREEILEVPDGYLAAVSGDRRILATVAGTQRFHQEEQDDHVIDTWRVEESTIQFWHVRSWKPVGPPRKVEGRIWNLLLSHDGTRVMLLGEGDEPFEFHDRSQWDDPSAWGREGEEALPGVTEVARTYAFPGSQYAFGHVQLADQAKRRLLAFSRDGRHVVTRESEPRIARIRDARTGRPVGPRLVHQGTIETAAFSLDGRLLVTGGSDKTARLWDAATGQPLAPPLRHDNSVVSAAFSPDGKTVVTHASGRLRFWDVGTAQSLGPPVLHGTGAAQSGALAFADDGRHVLSATNSGHLCLWQAPLAPLEGNAGSLAAWVSTLTLAHLDAAGVPGEQTVDQWQASVRRLQAVGGRPVSYESALTWHRREAEACLRNGFWFGGAWHLTRLIEAEPDRPAHYVNRARVYHESGRYEEAVDDCNRVLHEHPDEIEALHNRARAYTELEQWDDALADLSRVIEHDEMHFEAHYLRGLILIKREQWEQALAEFSAALRVRSILKRPADISELMFQAGRARFMLGHWEMAARNFSRVSPFSPRSLPSHYFRGLCYLNLQRDDEAVGEFKEAVAGQPSSEWVYFHLGRAQRLRADRLAQRDQREEAAEPYREAIEAFGGALKINRDHVGSLLERGFCYAMLKQSDEAQADFREVIRLNEDMADAYAGLGWSLESTDPEAAVDQYEEALRRNPNLGDARFGLASALAATGQLDRAADVYSQQLNENKYLGDTPLQDSWMVVARDEEFFSRLTAIMPDDYRPWAERGRAFALEHQWDRAAADYAEAMELVDTKPNRWWEPQATLAIHVAQWPEVYRRVLEQRPEDERLWVGLARHHASHGRWQEAADTLEKLIELHPDDHFCWYAMAPLKLRLGDTEGYRRVCDEMLDRWPRDDYKNIQERSVKVCLLTPDVMEDRLDEIVAMADDAVANVTDDNPNIKWFYLARGLAAFRAGDLDGARQWLAKCVPANPHCATAARLILAMVDCREGRVEPARKVYRDIQAFINARLSKPGSVERGLSFHDWLICDILRREAETTLGLQPSDDKTAKKR